MSGGDELPVGLRRDPHHVGIEAHVRGHDPFVAEGRVERAVREITLEPEPVGGGILEDRASDDQLPVRRDRERAADLVVRPIRDDDAVVAEARIELPVRE